MQNERLDRDFEKAMEECAAEPVHIPGTVQPFGCLVGVDSQSERIEYASENCQDIIGLKTSDLLGADLRSMFDHDIVHALNNAASRSGFDAKSSSLGVFKLGGGDVEIYAFASAGTHVLQFEAARDHELGGNDALSTLAFVMSEIRACPDQASLFALTTDLLRHLAGYDRVMIYKFDHEFNGEIIAETRQRAMEPFLGLHFPQWDIPAQARAIMAKFPLRFIEDVDQEPRPLSAINASMPPLDITLADCRGVSPVHMEYLRNMNVKSTMTLSVIVDDTLWGMISFHHRNPRTPSTKLREFLKVFLELFSAKLFSLIKQTQLDLVRRADTIKETVLDEIEQDESFEGSLSRIETTIREVLQADGVALLIGSKPVSYGRVPEQAVLEHLWAEMQAQLGTPIISNSLASRYPQFKDMLNGCAGMLASAVTPNRALCIFRNEAAQSVSWAGNPEKKIETLSGTARLSPRASFSRYLQDIEGRSEVWTDEDAFFAKSIWVLINSAERRALKNTLSRQQSLMIDELNHRVRNILALVRSVSRQARRHFGSLQSYSASLESRITALAAAHDIASGSNVAAVDINQLIHVETAPFQKDGRVSITGHSRFLSADIAPIFSLVIHELVTNAVKYGSLSVVNGTVTVTMSDAEDGVAIAWREQGGPVVVHPNDRGFGSALIEQAVPHEMGGNADLRFLPTGVEADLFLPNDILDKDPLPRVQRSLQNMTAPDVGSSKPFDPDAFQGFVLLLEDNFVIAKDTKEQLEEAGIQEVAIASNAGDALEILSVERPVCAILDINLGKGKTSEQVATELKRQGIPFLFVTGYGDNVDLAPEFKDIPRLTKPVATLELKNAMMVVLNRLK